jgi:hypothetical protein
MHIYVVFAAWLRSCLYVRSVLVLVKGIPIYMHEYVHIYLYIFSIKLLFLAVWLRSCLYVWSVLVLINGIPICIYTCLCACKRYTYMYIYMYICTYICIYVTFFPLLFRAVWLRSCVYVWSVLVLIKSILTAVYIIVNSPTRWYVCTNC